MFLLSVFWSFLLLPQEPYRSAKLVADEKIRIHGSCFDVQTGIDLKIKATALMQDRKIALGESDAEGNFDLRMDSGTRFLAFEAKGFHTAIIPVNIVGKIETSTGFKIRVPMIASDSQQVSMVTKVKPGTTDSAKRSPVNKMALFQIKAAHNGQRIPAKVCLTYTRTNRTQCFDADSTQAFTPYNLDQQDKIAFIVSADGYQDYIGTLINDQPDNLEELYKIKLLKSFHPLVLDFDVPQNLDIDYEITNGQTAQTNFSFKRGGHLPSLSLNIRAGQYQFIAKSGDGQILLNERMVLEPGINLKSVRLKKPDMAPAHVSGPTLKPSDTGQKKVVRSGTATLYFDQSSYHLRPEVKGILDSLSQIMISHPNLEAQITGYSDNVGKRQLNLILSEYRARVVVAYLKQKGIRPGQIHFSWKGPDSPAAPNDTEENRIKNRRVLVLFSER
ncbi:Peptidoglycan-associated lipoprotein [Dyadobacter sp. CECT 9275]|uniref:Peptidoglycan-associated lipoprotein n=1 Tax=Dyadobacter helix TaxID=2822344 RepID=A0A916JHS8_9BACT|nr:OmpA family protein [Dyadobacter sp. CECT 9275]CAG5017706.1 Peptidoglycan-associated lipoprotein [Dyadobacter sp. CECT 9275]